jgi:hypothetical protein
MQKEMWDLFMKETIRNQVSPIDERRSERFNAAIARDAKQIQQIESRDSHFRNEDEGYEKIVL